MYYDIEVKYQTRKEIISFTKATYEECVNLITSIMNSAKNDGIHVRIETYETGTRVKVTDFGELSC
ncbi:MAG: hypothetical protein II038_10775 [Lachnospiraceae bacterium]|nr:hypothetical protein [Lachnospiraceae bacterium]